MGWAGTLVALRAAFLFSHIVISLRFHSLNFESLLFFCHGYISSHCLHQSRPQSGRIHVRLLHRFFTSFSFFRIAHSLHTYRTQNLCTQRIGLGGSVKDYYLFTSCSSQGENWNYGRFTCFGVDFALPRFWGAVIQSLRCAALGI